MTRFVFKREFLSLSMICFLSGKNVIGHLNTILKNELTAINLYFLRAPSIRNCASRSPSRLPFWIRPAQMNHWTCG
ncbi:MAG TPA: hypothetical protein DEV64_12060 [Rhodospirillaceae bacterium]|nr:hypothetical protein [Rhodospirillaceae bacterium]